MFDQVAGAKLYLKYMNKSGKLCLNFEPTIHTVASSTMARIEFRNEVTVQHANETC